MVVVLDGSVVVVFLIVNDVVFVVKCIVVGIKVFFLLLVMFFGYSVYLNFVIFIVIFEWRDGVKVFNGMVMFWLFDVIGKLVL